ncbi:MAG: hypothetical protein ACREAB_04365, partial [Blastocatellia bacterium]
MLKKSYFIIIVPTLLLATFGVAGINGARVTSDVAPLRATIVFSLGDQIFKSSDLGGAGSNRHPLFGSLPRGVIREHQALRDLLQKQNVRVFDVRELLDSAIRNARRENKLAEWLKQTFPATADEAIKRIDAIDAGSALNLRDDHFYQRREDGSIDPMFPGLPS